MIRVLLRQSCRVLGKNYLCQLHVSRYGFSRRGSILCLSLSSMFTFYGSAFWAVFILDLVLSKPYVEQLEHIHDTGSLDLKRGPAL